jgi:hypothetical protein
VRSVAGEPVEGREGGTPLSHTTSFINQTLLPLRIPWEPRNAQPLGLLRCHDLRA